MDLRDKLVSEGHTGSVSVQQGYELAEQIGALGFVETSAKAGTGLMELDHNLRTLCLARATECKIVGWDEKTDEEKVVRPFRTPEPQAEEAGPESAKPEPVVEKAKLVAANVYEPPVQEQPAPAAAVEDDSTTVPRPAAKKELTGKGGKKIHDSDDGCCLLM